jgi:drug/metabolite transporter (DMT)-like permease
LDTSFILISILALCLYNVSLKTFPEKLILFFWVNLCSYIGFLGMYFFSAFVLNQDAQGFHNLIYQYTYQDLPLYILIAFSFLGSMIASGKLMDGYDLSLVIPMTQLGIILASAGYIALGDPFQWSLLLGLLLVCTGTVVISLAAVPQSSTVSALSRLRNMPKRLWFLTMGQAVCFTVSAMVSYLGTKKTVHTEMIIQSLRHLHIGPMSFHNAFHFSLGQQLFSVSIFLIYIFTKREYRGMLFLPVINNVKHLALVVLAYLLATFTYINAFTMTEDTTILLALDNLSIPITLFLSFLILNEELTRTKILGSSLIVLGGVIAVL